MNEDSSNKQDLIVALFLGAVVLGLIGAVVLYRKNVESDADKDLLYNQSPESFLDGTREVELEGQNDVLSESTQSMNNKTYIQKPTMSLKESIDYSALLKTNKGDITLDLFEEDSPVTVNNFIFLARDGFYDGVIFHRVIKDFMIQGGDPEGTGRGGPGYDFEDEINDKKLVAGSLAMANAGPDTNGSQFFIVTAPSTPWLDGKHTNFGMVTKGMEVVKAIESSPTGVGDRPRESITINSIEIIETPKP